MEDLKIRVANSSESKEVQQLFFELGYGFEGCKIKTIQHLEYTSDYYFFAYAHDMDLTHSCDYGVFINKAHKEITIPELRDLVVLNRNDVGDATHTDPNEKESLYFRLFGDWWNLFTGGKWQQFCHMDSPRAAKLKPIEKPMKEYLRKNNDGEYILEVTDEREAQEPHAKHWIEVPKGCDYLISVFGVNSFIDSDMFAKFKTKNVLWSRKPMKEYLIKSGDGKYLLTHHDSIGAIEIPGGSNIAVIEDSKVKFYSKYTSADLDHLGKDLIWMRPSHPEALPFIDDEPLQSLNGQTQKLKRCVKH